MDAEIEASKMKLHYHLNKPLILDTSLYSVLPFDSSKQIFGFINRTVFPKSSRPSLITSSDLMEIEKRLQACINDFNLNQKIINGPHGEIELSKYKRQLIITINSDGEKEVLVNCFCSEEPDWKNRAIEVIDGGECYFNVIINDSLKKYYDFDVNSIS